MLDTTQGECQASGSCLTLFTLHLCAGRITKTLPRAEDNGGPPERSVPIDPAVLHFKVHPLFMACFYSGRLRSTCKLTFTLPVIP